MMDKNNPIEQFLNKNMESNLDERSKTPLSDASDGSFHSLNENIEALGIGNDSEVSTDSADEDTEFFCPAGNEKSQDPPIAATPSDDSLLDKMMKDDEVDEETDEYFVDEERLKDVELNLSNEDKAIRQKEIVQEKEKGNDAFKDGRFHEAALTYTAGLRRCPLSCSKDRAILYANRAAARAKLDQKKPAIGDCTKAIELDENYVRAILRRAKLEEETDSPDEALNDFKKVLELDPTNCEAIAAIVRLPPIINERNEKLKEEMMGKLKDLGNVFLRPFGLSTDNFKVNQDPNSGGYNVQFEQKPSNS